MIERVHRSAILIEQGTAPVVHVAHGQNVITLVRLETEGHNIPHMIHAYQYNLYKNLALLFV
jgi:hypothetical protein